MDKTVKLNRKNTTVSELAIYLLSENWPQNLKSLHLQISQQGKTVSMQAVHKSVSRLVEEKILQKKDKQYSLNKEWVEQINSFSSQAKQAYKNQMTKQ